MAASIWFAAEFFFFVVMLILTVLCVCAFCTGAFFAIVAELLVWLVLPFHIIYSLFGQIIWFALCLLVGVMMAEI
jgi:hypothetical protein